MTQQKFEFRGHVIAVQVFLDEDLWGWQFRIGDEPPVVLRLSSARNETGARAEAMLAAKTVITLREGAI